MMPAENWFLTMVQALAASGHDPERPEPECVQCGESHTLNEDGRCDFCHEHPAALVSLIPAPARVPADLRPTMPVRGGL